MTHIAKDTAPVQEPCQYAVDVAMPEYRCVGKCQYAAQPAPVQEPIGYLFQHEETGLTTVVDVQQVEWGFEKNNPRHQKIGPVYTTPPAAQRQWVDLTNEQIKTIDEIALTKNMAIVMTMATLKEKNT